MTDFIEMLAKTARGRDGGPEGRRRGNDNGARRRRAHQGPSQREGPAIVIRRGGQLLNTFTEMQAICYSAISYLFLLGEGVPEGDFPDPLDVYCMRHGSQAHARDMPWVFFRLNCRHRHANIRAVNAVSRANPEEERGNPNHTYQTPQTPTVGSPRSGQDHTRARLLHLQFKFIPGSKDQLILALKSVEAVTGMQVCVVWMDVDGYRCVC